MSIFIVNKFRRYTDMFKRTRLKIMIFITTTVMLLLVGTVGAIALSSYIEEYNQTVGADKNGLLELFEYSVPDEDAAAKTGSDGDASLPRKDMEAQLSIIKRFVGVLIRNTFRIGLFIVILVFSLSYFIAGWILKPLEESYKRQKQFISDAGHELKTPVATIDANAELLYGDIGDNKWLDNIRYESRRMTELIRQLLDLVRTETVKNIKEDVDLGRIVMGSALVYEAVAFEKGYLIETDIDDDIVIHADKGQMEQLAAILIDNAIDHASGDGAINISLKKDRSRVILRISNPGDKITDEDMKNLFERFYRADKAHSDNGHYGLGLAIAKAIVTSHKGSISVKSGGGVNVFTVEL
ncbi:sensor histidine kinase [Butyrivibrio fibrisolvens]|nr:HAMP domain-containing sensor histidine kinase [Butyrivibrio fibrisolvens]